MNAGEIRKMSDEQLVHREMRAERELVEVNFRHHTDQLEDTSQRKQLRREIARLRTIQRERERELGLAMNTLRQRHQGTFVAEGTVSGEPDESGRGFLRGIVDRFKGKE